MHVTRVVGELQSEMNPPFTIKLDWLFGATWMGPVHSSDDSVIIASEAASMLLRNCAQVKIHIPWCISKCLEICLRFTSREPGAPVGEKYLPRVHAMAPNDPSSLARRCPRILFLTRPPSTHPFLLIIGSSSRWLGKYPNLPAIFLTWLAGRIWNCGKKIFRENYGNSTILLSSFVCFTSWTPQCITWVLPQRYLYFS
jgi:hypothetical protein